MRLPSRSKVLVILTALFVGVPLLDTATMVLAGRLLGFWPTLAIMILSGVVGAMHSFSGLSRIEKRAAAPFPFAVSGSVSAG